MYYYIKCKPISTFFAFSLTELISKSQVIKERHMRYKNGRMTPDNVLNPFEGQWAVLKESGEGEIVETKRVDTIRYDKMNPIPHLGAGLGPTFNIIQQLLVVLLHFFPYLNRRYIDHFNIWIKDIKNTR